MSRFIIAYLIAYLISLIGTPLTMKLAKKVDALDYPDEKRKKQKQPIPRLGGVAIVTAFVITAIISLIYLVKVKNTYIKSDMRLHLTGFFIGMIIIQVMGVIDDIKGLSAKIKFLIQSLVAILLIFCDVRIKTFQIPFQENIIKLHFIPSVIFTYFWIVGIINAINLIDGLDGLASSISLVAVFSFSYVFITQGASVIYIFFTIAVAGAITGFLPYNLYPAKTYLGDSGSYFLGYFLSVITLLGTVKTHATIILFTPILVLIFPIFEVISSMTRRYIRTKTIKGMFQPDDGHTHHKLVKSGLSVAQTTRFLTITTFFSSVFSIIILEGEWPLILLYLIISISILRVHQKITSKIVTAEEYCNELDEDYDMLIYEKPNKE